MTPPTVITAIPIPVVTLIPIKTILHAAVYPATTVVVVTITKIKFPIIETMDTNISSIVAGMATAINCFTILVLK